MQKCTTAGSVHVVHKQVESLLARSTQACSSSAPGVPKQYPSSVLRVPRLECAQGVPKQYLCSVQGVPKRYLCSVQGVSKQ